MKKVLYGTTALLAAGMFASAAEAAQPLKLAIGGYLNAFIGYTEMEAYDANKQVNNQFDVATEGQVAFTASTKLDNGLKVGAVAEVNLSDFAGQDYLGDVYVTAEGKYGKAILGATDNVAVMLHNSAPDAGIFGVDKSKIVKWLGIDTLVNNDSTAIDFDGNAQKVSYVSPKFAGVSLGASWIPGADIAGAYEYGNGAIDSNIARGTAAEFRSAYVLAAAYEGKVKGVELGADIAYGNVDVIGKDNHAEYSIGAKVGVSGFTLGGAYKIVDHNTTGEKKDKVFNVGVGYENGPYAVSASYFKSKNGKDNDVKGAELDIWQVSGKYNLGAGVDAFATFALLDGNKESPVYTSKNGEKEDSTWTVVTGLALKF